MRTGAYEEVEVLLDGNMSLEQIRSLPQAPDGIWLELSDPISLWWSTF